MTPNRVSHERTRWPALEFRRCKAANLTAITRGIQAWNLMPSGLRHVVVTFVLCFAVLLSGCAAQQDDSLAALEQSFQTPPDDCRIMMRWWWFGPAVTKPELQRELEQMKANGIGGVEIATLYPLALDDPTTGFHNQRFLSAEHLENLRFAATTARQLSLRVDITLGSGWPFGGPEIPVTQAAGELRVELKPIPAGSDSIAVPDIGTGERLIAAFLAPVKDGTPSLPDARQVSTVANARVEISPPLPGAQDAIFFISSRTGMMVKRAALAAEGFVLDHYDGKAIEAHLSATGDRLLGAFGDHPPYAVFSDSLEDEGSNWTPGKTRLRSHAISSRPHRRRRAFHERRPSRLGKNAHRTGRGALPAAAAFLGTTTPHIFSFAILRHSPGDAFEPPLCRSPRRRRQGLAEDVA